MTNGNESVIATGFRYLAEWGFLDIVIPFILFYSIVFGMLERTQLFKRPEEEKISKRLTNLHSLIAFAIAITATSAAQLIGITRAYLPVLSVISLILIGVMLTLSMIFGEQFEEMQKDNKIYNFIGWGFAITALLAGAIIAFYYSGLLVEPCTGNNPETCTPLMNMQAGKILGIQISDILTPEVMNTIIPLVVLAVIIGLVMLVTRRPEG